jgi:hypothetical protein
MKIGCIDYLVLESLPIVDKSKSQIFVFKTAIRSHRRQQQRGESGYLWPIIRLRNGKVSSVYMLVNF